MEADLGVSDGRWVVVNSGVITGNVTINIVSDLSSETGAIPLDQTTEEGVGGYTITIKPSGAARTISGSSDSWILKITDADRRFHFQQMLSVSFNVNLPTAVRLSE